MWELEENCPPKAAGSKRAHRSAAAAAAAATVDGVGDAGGAGKLERALAAGRTSSVTAEAAMGGEVDAGGVMGEEEVCGGDRSF